jgi:hypothetical protein
MFAVESPVVSFCARLSGRKQHASNKAGRSMENEPTSQDPRRIICDALADMRPSTAAEIAEATGLDKVTAAAYLDELSARYRVMFNPLTKRYSLPKAWPTSGIAA